MAMKSRECVLGFYEQSGSLFIGGNLVLGCVTPPHVDIGGLARALAPVLKALELAIFGGYPQKTPTPPTTSGLISETRALRPVTNLVAVLRPVAFYFRQVLLHIFIFLHLHLLHIFGASYSVK
jgi:hypothetical protein